MDIGEGMLRRGVDPNFKFPNELSEDQKREITNVSLKLEKPSLIIGEGTKKTLKTLKDNHFKVFSIDELLIFNLDDKSILFLSEYLELLRQ